jgi:DNA-binding NtrC family response regulator
MKDAILCVDDEAIVLVSLKQELRSRFKDEFTYETARSAGEALELIADLTQDGIQVRAILSDWLMPGIKGDEFLRVVHRKHPEIKSVIVTGHNDLEKLADLDTIGLVAVLQKPWKNEDLIDAVEKCVGEY